MAQIKIKILKKIFFNEENGYTVCKAQIQNQQDTITIVGNLFDVNEGDFLEIEGEPSVHPKFGEQIKIKTYTPLLPQDIEGITNYLAGRIHGIGKRTAKKIAARFGSETFKILEENPERLREIKGVKKTVVADIKKNITDNILIRDLTVKLSPFGIGPETIFKIYKEFGERSFLVLEHNPYSLIDQIRGIGFKIADTIAQGMGIPANAPERLSAGIDFIASQVEQRNGDIYMDESDLIVKAASLLNASREDLTAALNRLIEKGDLVRENIPEPIIVSAKNYAIEKTISEYLLRLSRSSTNLEPVKIDFDYIFNRTSVDLTEEQRNAVIAAVNNRITIITGGPGTGKTTIIRAIIESIEKDGKSVLIAAPTGRAAKRIEEATMYQASTIHRMLQIDAETRRFVHNEQKPLKADFIIVDEFSMVDFYIFYSLLKAISQHSRLIIIGDKDQLPSVGPGNVLRDIIGSGYFNVIYLSRNFRQNEDSLIIENAYRINNGDDLIFKPYSDELDFVFIKVDNEQKAMDKVIGIIEYHKNDYNYNSPDYQVMVPMYRGEAGIDNLNSRIQDTFNPEPVVVKREKCTFKKYDKVMQLKNNYEKEIFNGEQGYITDYNPDKKTLTVNFDDRYIEYCGDEIEELTLSYAVSVHKAQGSEFDMMMLVMLPAHGIMLTRELFYTAVTRARKKIFLISDRDTIRRAALNSKPSERKTLLPRRLEEVFAGQKFLAPPF